jgi:ATP-dependent DNA helicase RecQ
LHQESKAERYAWIRKNIEKLPGAGIIYCLTQRDCQQLSDFLCRNGVVARPYYSSEYLNKIDNSTGMSLNEETEQLFLNNQIKVIVATIKLGMGYDKSDIGFVIHFQRPNSIVAY